ncbi:MAG: hypothetical protein U0941_24775 [Planctomycetaceae bacterium]
MLFLLVGEVARARGLMALIDVLWRQVDLIAGWVIYAARLLWVGLIVSGFVPYIQRGSALCLSLLAIFSVGVIVTLSSTRIGLGEMLFLIPCVMVAGLGLWLCFRTVGP